MIIDGDIQDPPENSQNFLLKIKEGYEFIYRIRGKRIEPLIICFFFAIFYQIWSRINGRLFLKQVGNFCVINQRLAAEIKDLPERSLYFRGIRARLGYKSHGIVYDRSYRKAGN